MEGSFFPSSFPSFSLLLFNTKTSTTAIMIAITMIATTRAMSLRFWYLQITHNNVSHQFLEPSEVTITVVQSIQNKAIDHFRGCRLLLCKSNSFSCERFSSRTVLNQKHEVSRKWPVTSSLSNPRDAISQSGPKVLKNLHHVPSAGKQTTSAL